MPPYYLTTPIYYVNDAPHVGTAYTTVNADALARWHRLLGDDVWFMTGTDEHGAKIVEAAEANGTTPKEWTDRTSARFVEAWRRLDISNDDFIRTTEPRHYEVVQQFLQRIYDNGFIELGSYSGLYCVSCEDYYTEDQLVDGKCPVHGRPVIEMKEDNYFFKLSQFEQRLLDYYDSHPDFVRPTSKRNEALGFIRGGLRDVSITRTSFTWGVPVPWDSGHVFYVWYDALINYLTVAGYGGDPAVFEARWGAAHHLIGKDILKFHCVWWPAMCMAAGHRAARGDLRARLPAHGRAEARQDDDRVRAGRDRGCRGRSRSPTSRRWPWPTTSASTRCATTCCATCRWAATATSPTRASWRATTPTWPTTSGNLVSRVTTVVHSKCGGVGPGCNAVSELAPVAAGVLGAATAAWARWAPHEALEETWRLIGAANAELEAAEPWKMEPGPAVDAVLGDALEVLRIVAVLIAPAMPSTAVEVWRRIGLAGDPSAAGCPGTPVGRLRRRRSRGEGGAPVPAAQGLTVAGWFDSHCHVQEEYLPGGEAGATDLEPVLARAAEAGIDRLVCIGTGAATSEQAVAVARATAGAGTGPRAWASIGLHPHEASEGVDEVAALLARELAADDGAVVAVGRVRAGLLLRALAARRAARGVRGADRVGARARPCAGDPRPRRLARSVRRAARPKACPNAPCCTASPVVPTRSSTACAPACTSRSAAS